MLLACLVAAVVAAPATGQMPKDVKWYKPVTDKEAILFAPGEAISVTTWIKGGTGDELTWKLVGQDEKVHLESEAPVKLGAEDVTFTVNSPGLPEGFYIIRMWVRKDGRVVERGIMPVGVYGPIPKPDASVSEPFFPFGVYDKYVISRDPVIIMTYLHAVCRTCRKMGVNMLTSGNTLWGPTKEQLDVCRAYGIRVMLRDDWNFRGGDELRNHPAVITLMFGDEPSMKNIESYKQAYDEKQAKYPDKTVVTCLIAGSMGTLSDHDPLLLWPKLKPRLRMIRLYCVRKTDFDGMLSWRPGTMSASAVFHMADASYDTPWWYIAPTFGANATDLRPNPHWRNPSAGELKGLLHLALAYGCKGVTAYSLQTHMGTEANPSPSLVTQDTLAPEDHKYKAYSEMAHWVAKMKTYLLLKTQIGGLDVSADRPEVEVIPRRTDDGRQFLYVVNKDGNHEVTTGVKILAMRLGKITDLYTRKDVSFGFEGRWPLAKVTLGPGDGALWELDITNGPLPAEKVDTAATLTFVQPMIRPLGEDRTIYKLLQPMPLWWQFAKDPVEVFSEEHKAAKIPSLKNLAVDKKDIDTDQPWAGADFDASDWPYLQVGTFWDSQGVRHMGVAWYRCTFEPNAAVQSAKDVKLFFQAVDESAWVWLNGEFLGANHPRDAEGWDKSFVFDVTGKLKPGRNVLVVRVLNRGAAGGIFGNVGLVAPTDQKKPEFWQTW